MKGTIIGRIKKDVLLAMKKEQIKNGIGAVLTCFALLVSLNADLSGISEEAAAGGFLTVLAVQIKKLEYLLPVFDYRNAVLAFLVFVFFFRTDEEWQVYLPRWSYRIPALLSAFFMVFGYSFRYTDSWNLIWMDGFHLLVSAGMMTGFFLLFSRIFSLLIRWVCHISGESEEPFGKLTEWVGSTGLCT